MQYLHRLFLLTLVVPSTLTCLLEMIVNRESHAATLPLNKELHEMFTITIIPTFFTQHQCFRFRSPFVSTSAIISSVDT